MVERQALRILIEPMSLADVPDVHRIERVSFSVPWPDDAYRAELTGNRLAAYLVARADGAVVGYGGIWMMVDEAHITTFAIEPAWRRQRLGETLLVALLDLAIARRAREATLEVRLSNVPARRRCRGERSRGWGPSVRARTRARLVVPRAARASPIPPGVGWS